MTIDKSYWNDKSKIPASLKEKKELFDYEKDMFNMTNQELIKGKDLSLFEKNLLVESLALHSRVLIDFFYGEKKCYYDIMAEDFIENWSTLRPYITQTLFDAKNKADKQLAHLSTWRLKIERDNKKNWSKTLKSDMEKVINEFEKNNTIGLIGKK